MNDIKSLLQEKYQQIKKKLDKFSGYNAFGFNEEEIRVREYLLGYEDCLKDLSWKLFKTDLVTGVKYE